MTIFRTNKKPAAAAVDNIFIESFMPSAPETAVKAYIYGLMLAQTGDTETDIKAALGITDEELNKAFSYWEALGLIKVVSTEPLNVCFLDPSDAHSDVKDGSFRYSDFVKELQKVLGTRVLTGAELKKLYDWLDVFGFSQDAAVEIVRYCLDKKGARTQVGYMDAVAKSIAAQGAFTLEAVRAYFEEAELLNTGAARIMKRWNRKGLPSKDEIALYEKWTKGWGVDEQTLDAALSQMVSAEKKTFGYLDGILESWRREGKLDREKLEDYGKKTDAAAELAREAFKRAGLKKSPDREQVLTFSMWLYDWSMSAELILLAAEYALKDARPFAQMKRTIVGWHEEGISSLNAAKESYERNAGFTKGARSTSRALSYMHGGEYSEEELKKLDITFGEEFYDSDDAE